LTGVLLPDTPPFETDGRLVAKIDPEKSSVFDYRDFNGRIGDSDIHGTLAYTTGKPRPMLKGDVESRQLRLADLGPLIGGFSKGRNGQNNLNSAKVRRAFSLRTRCCRMTVLKLTNGTWMLTCVSKDGVLSTAVACRSAISPLISS
jgi:hypothetical protein